MKNLYLTSGTSKELYEHIKDLPIIDYHNHLDPKEIYENKPFTDISDMWLEHDHYKWRLMRFSGYESNGSKLKRFKDYAESIENAYFNPLYDWTRMELKSIFNIDEELTGDNYVEIYTKANNYLKNNPLGPRDILEKFHVESLCTTDDITSDLQYHFLLKEETNINVLPTFRPDRLFHPSLKDQVFVELETVEKKAIDSLDKLEKALINRINHFEYAGCKLADHGITKFEYIKTSKSRAEVLFDNYLQDKLDEEETIQLNSYILSFLMSEYKKRNWTVQFHLGALRNTNDKEFSTYGVDSGYDSISGYNYTNNLTEFLNDIETTSGLPRMILYPLNSNHYEEIAVLCGSFSKEVPGKIQLGAAWWFHDHKGGIEKHLQVFAEYLNLNNFVGMLTDSRSFLSFVRHDYFRRILANFVGMKIESGVLNTDISRVKKLLENIAYKNSKNYLNL